MTQVKEKEQVYIDEELKEIGNEEVDLIVFNDNYNYFEWVVETFMEVCHLNYEEALRKTWHIHTYGMGVVRSGPYDEIKPMKEELNKRGLNAIISRNGN